MTLKDLGQLYWLHKEIDMDTRRIRELGPEADDIRAIIEDQLARCIRERDALEDYIAAIDDDFTRRVFILRFAEGLSWEQVAACMGGKNSSAAMRMIVRRHIAKTGRRTPYIERGGPCSRRGG